MLLARIACLSVVLTAGAASAQQVSVGAGSSWSFSNAIVDLGCSDLVVSGSLNTQSAAVSQARNVTISGGGTLDAGSATFDVTGDWTRAGTFAAGTSEVRFVDGCGTTSSTISGPTSFDGLTLTTTTGKQVSFAAGETTSVGGMFSANGSIGNLLAIRSTLDGSEAFLALSQAEMGTYVDVKDNHAIPEMVTLALGSLISGNATGWRIGIGVPSVPLPALLLLAAGLHAVGRRTLRRRARVLS